MGDHLEKFLQIYRMRDLLITKLNTYGFDMSAMQFAHTLESRIIGGVGIIGRGGGRGLWRKWLFTLKNVSKND